ncbi:MAG: transcription-repair coupling factor [Spirochaetae bacterium HGW-Spirochaetae-1]|jgi:transcription-repair coupling factor (superfamily II helicase)|nr:MAG: transcription-repair coupling factor [Spirochaetae bacterium HGW-Spirochaetae-1]
MILKPLSDKFIHSEEFRSMNISAAPFSIEGIAPSSYPLIIASLFHSVPGQYLVVADTTQKMHDLFLDLGCFIPEQSLYQLPPWETLPYEFVSPPEKVERDRITALYRMIGGKPSVFVTTMESLLRRIPHRDFFIKKGLSLSINEEYPFDDLVETLVSYGYTREPRVESFGQFSIKGGIIDIFLPAFDNPVRLDFFDDALESIREFDAVSQISSGRLESITLYPRRELVLFSREKEKLLARLKKAGDEGYELTDEIRSQVEQGSIDRISGIEDLFPLALESDVLLSYLNDSARIIFLDTAELAAKRNLLERTFNELYAKRREKFFCLPPVELISVSAYEEAAARAITLQTFTATPGALNWRLRSIPNFHGKIKLLREELDRRIEDGWDIIITTGFEGQARRLHDLLASYGPDDDFDSVSENHAMNIIISPCHEGIEVPGIKTLLLSDHDVFGKSYRKKKQFKKKSSRPIESFLDLREEDYVVHINHGIGIFRGIERMAAGGVERDFLLIEYADGDKLYVSLDQITMVQKYIGFEGRRPRIDALGKKSAWNRIKDKVRESVAEIARELIEIYSQRSALKGFQYPPDTLWQEEFESLFEYEETPDQITAIEDVKDDMESARPMDRLICGDVGFGKTEVAIRASFKAVMAGRQVAILVPTTVLAMQHFNTFKRRFADYPISIDMVSRFRSRTQILQSKDRLARGEIDIIIGTHALVTGHINFKNLGLLIIDEEQKFGVRHKEQLKKMRAMVDVLTLSATPIPRTLHMSLAGIRDLSTIATPPENRQAIETYVMEDNPDILRMAILNEVERDGQVFYVHNRVQTIDGQAEMLQKIVPGVSIGVAHGQMHEHELEEIMIDFLNKKYDVLVSTTIIESGLDMPNVNTIIINRADTLGLSQLYQLKGRVGRSIRQSYAYLFYPRHFTLTEEAQKRLQVIAEYSELGSGLKIAMKDLEIRGAGNILGREQSGSIMEVGFELYCQMLDDAVRRLKGEKPSTIYRTPVFIKTDFFIPDTYMADQRQKIEFYKRFESCENMDEVEQLKNELTDRFGPPPPEVNILIELEEIRTLASQLFIDEILEHSHAIKIRISGQSAINMEKLVRQIAEDDRLSMDPRDNVTLVFVPHAMETEKKLSELKKWLQQIS